MKGSATPADTIAPIQAEIGPGLLREVFGGKPFIRALVELLKNARDWGATRIEITTTDQARIIITDNGRGMDAANRNSFASVNRTTGKGPRQSARFGTGSKQMLFSHAKHVAVVTATSEESAWIWRFAITTDGYEEIALARGTITPERQAKSHESWPHPFATGTVIAYEFRNPKSSAISRGGELAEELAARLPLKFGDVVSVDGKLLPPKRIVGTLFRRDEQHPQLGTMGIEIYRPERRTTEDDLRLAAVEVGEVRMRAFHQLLKSQAGRLPDVFLLPEVCGTIVAPFLREHADEGRTTLRPTVVDDPRTVIFLNFLRAIAPDVERRLQIKTRAEVTESDQDDVAEIARLCNRRYNEGGQRPKGAGGMAEDAKGGRRRGKDRDADEESSVIGFNLDRREFEIEEEFDVKLEVRPPFRRDEVVWYLDRARATAEEMSFGKRLVARDSGHGVIRADLPNTQHSAAIHFEIVPQRLFRLSIPWAEVQLGSELPIMCVNSDKLTGEVQWRHRGAGRIQVEGRRVTFSATSEGEAVITAVDTADESRQASCDVSIVTTRSGSTLCVRGEFFTYAWYDLEVGASVARPATMLVGDPVERVHRLLFNRAAPGYDAARSAGMLKPFLAQVIGAEFARFRRFELGGVVEGSLDPRDVSGVVQEIMDEGLAVFDELMQLMSGKK